MEHLGYRLAQELQFQDVVMHPELKTMAKKLKHVTLNNWTCHPLRWGNLGKTHSWSYILVFFFLRGGFRWKKRLEMFFFGFLGIPIFTCPLKLQNPNLQFWRSKLQHMWEIIIKDDKKGNPIFSTRFMVKAHHSKQIFSSYPTRIPATFLCFFCSFYPTGHVLRLLNVTIGFQLFLSFGKW